MNKDNFSLEELIEAIKEEIEHFGKINPDDTCVINPNSTKEFILSVKERVSSFLEEVLNENEDIDEYSDDFGDDNFFLLDDDLDDE